MLKNFLGSNFVNNVRRIPTWECNFLIKIFFVSNFGVDVVDGDGVADNAGA